MKKDLLFPRWCRPVGFVLFILSVILFVAMNNYNFEFSFLNTPEHVAKTNEFFVGNNNLTDEFMLTGIVLSLLMIAFSRQKQEDEYVRYIRLRSLQLSVYVNYLVFLVAVFTMYGLNFLSALFYNFLTVLLIFILVFYFNLHIKPLFTRKSGV